MGHISTRNCWPEICSSIRRHAFYKSLIWGYSRKSSKVCICHTIKTIWQLSRVLNRCNMFIKFFFVFLDIWCRTICSVYELCVCKTFVMAIIIIFFFEGKYYWLFFIFVYSLWFQLYKKKQSILVPFYENWNKTVWRKDNILQMVEKSIFDDLKKFQNLKSNIIKYI